MKKWSHIFRKKKTEQGQGLIEYGLLILLVGVAAIVAVNLFEESLRDAFDDFIGRGEFAPPSLGPLGGNFTAVPATETPLPNAPQIISFAVDGANPYQIGSPTETFDFPFVIDAQDPDGDDTIVQFKLDVDENNDGTIDQTFTWLPGEAQPRVTLGKGNHVLELTVTDDTGLTTSRDLSVRVYEDVSELEDLPPTVNIISIDPPSGRALELINFRGVAQPDHDSTIVRYTWVLGNGATRSGAEISYEYPESGTYEVYLQAEDNEGKVADSEIRTIVIEPSLATPTSTPSLTPTPDLKLYTHILLFVESEVNGQAVAAVAELYALDGSGNQIDRAGWGKSYVNSESQNAERMWDGNSGTYWLTAGGVTHPHQVQVSLGDQYSLSGFQYIPRQDDDDGRIRGYRFCASTDGVNFELLRAGVLTNSTQEQVVTFAPPAPGSTFPNCIPAPTATPTNTPTSTPLPTLGPITACTTSSVEAESATLTGRFELGSDGNASNGQYIHVPNGRGSSGSTPPYGDSATFQFTTTIDGTYRLRGYVYAPNGQDDSFWVDVNAGTAYLWDTRRSSSYQDDFVSDRGGDDPVEFDLLAGTHNIRVMLREDGTRLDRLELVCVAEILPTPTPLPATILFQDDFNRGNNGTVGNGWSESENNNNRIEIENNRLCVDRSNNDNRRPMATHTFTAVTTGEAVLTFDFDWERNGGGENEYFVYMQLGDSADVRENDYNDGIAANVLWGNVGQQENLAYQIGNNLTGLVRVSGQHQIMIVADLDANTYSVTVDGTTYQTGIPFDKEVDKIDTVRFFTRKLNTNNLPGGCFDNVVVSRR